MGPVRKPTSPNGLKTQRLLQASKGPASARYVCVRSDISVILLSYSQRPKVAASDTSDSVAAMQQVYCFFILLTRISCISSDLHKSKMPIYYNTV